MKVNFLVYLTNTSIEQSGIVNSARRFADLLRKNGVEVDINGEGYDYDIFHSHMPLPTFRHKFKIARKKGIKIITHAHSTAQDLEGSFTLTKSKTVLRVVEKYFINFYNQADLVLTPSEWTKGLLQRSGVKRPIEVISNGVDIKKFKYDKKRCETFRKEYGVGKNEKIVYSVGLVFLRKGIKTFSEVAKKMPDVNFFWMGKVYKSILVNPRDMENVFKNLPENCKFLGFVKDIIGGHSAGDAFFFPSYAENQGIVILEAAACKKPIVVRDLPVYKSWLFEGKNCVKANSVNGFKKGLEKVLYDKKLRDRLVKNGTILARENDINNIVKQLIGYYETLLG